LRKKGFTLVELLIVVIIIGILATIAVPQYSKMVEKTKMAEAKSILGSIMTAQELYNVEHGEYTDDVNDLMVELPADTSMRHYYVYDVDAASTTATWSATAARKITGGITGKDWYSDAYDVTIDQDGNLEDTLF